MADFLYKGQNLTLERIIPWLPWLLIFVLANAAEEELLFRGLFLRKLRPFYGKFLSNAMIAFVLPHFLHFSVSSTSNDLMFLIGTTLMALAWGALMQKTDRSAGLDPVPCPAWIYQSCLAFFEPVIFYPCKHSTSFYPDPSFDLPAEKQAAFKANLLQRHHRWLNLHFAAGAFGTGASAADVGCRYHLRTRSAPCPPIQLQRFTSNRKISFLAQLHGHDDEKLTQLFAADPDQSPGQRH